jgi:hypothetical protein
MKYIGEMFEDLRAVAEAHPRNQRAERKKLLQRYDNPTVRFILQLGLDPVFVFDVGDDVDPTVKRIAHLPVNMAMTNLYAESRKLYLLLAPPHGNPGLTTAKRRQIYAQKLEMLHPMEADLLSACRHKNLGKYGLTEQMIHEVFPGLLSTYKPQDVVSQEDGETSITDDFRPDTPPDVSAPVVPVPVPMPVPAVAKTHTEAVTGHEYNLTPKMLRQMKEHKMTIQDVLVAGIKSLIPKKRGRPRKADQED